MGTELHELSVPQGAVQVSWGLPLGLSWLRRCQGRRFIRAWIGSLRGEDKRRSPIGGSVATDCFSFLGLKYYPNWFKYYPKGNLLCRRRLSIRKNFGSLPGV